MESLFDEKDIRTDAVCPLFAIITQKSIIGIRWGEIFEKTAVSPESFCR